MSDIIEVAQAKDPIKGDEIFFGLKFEDIPYAFQISEENTWENDFVYRIYHFDTIQWKRIEQREFEQIKELCRTTALLHNSNNYISSELNCKDLLDIWKKHFPLDS